MISNIQVYGKDINWQWRTRISVIQTIESDRVKKDGQVVHVRLRHDAVLKFYTISWNPRVWASTIPNEGPNVCF